MRLRVSGQETGQDYDITAVVAGTELAPNVADGAIMQVFVDAVMDRDGDAVEKIRLAVSAQCGDAAMIDAAAVIAAFNAYPRIADATGIPLEDAKAAATAELREELGLGSMQP